MRCFLDRNNGVTLEGSKENRMKNKGHNEFWIILDENSIDELFNDKRLYRPQAPISLFYVNKKEAC